MFTDDNHRYSIKFWSYKNFNVSVIIFTGTAQRRAAQVPKFSVAPTSVNKYRNLKKIVSCKALEKNVRQKRFLQLIVDDIARIHKTIKINNKIEGTGLPRRLGPIPRFICALNIFNNQNTDQTTRRCNTGMATFRNSQPSDCKYWWNWNEIPTTLCKVRNIWLLIPNGIFIIFVYIM